MPAVTLYATFAAMPLLDAVYPTATSTSPAFAFRAGGEKNFVLSGLALYMKFFPTSARMPAPGFANDSRSSSRLRRSLLKAAPRR